MTKDWIKVSMGTHGYKSCTQEAEIRKPQAPDQPGLDEDRYNMKVQKVSKWSNNHKENQTVETHIKKTENRSKR